MELSPLPTSLKEKTHSRPKIGRHAKRKRGLDPIAQLALMIFQLRRQRRSYFDAALFAEASWDILLNLRAHHNSDRSAASMFVSECAPTSTGLRHLNKLEQYGLVERWTDPTDRRRRFARLSEEGLQRMDQFLSSLRER